MKKIISFVSLLAILLSFCIISVGAESDKFNIDEAYALFDDAYGRYTMFRMGDGCAPFAIKNGNVYEIYLIKRLDYTSEEKAVYRAHSNGKTYIQDEEYGYSTFVSVPEFNSNYDLYKPKIVDKNFTYVFKTIDDVKNYYLEVFTSELAEKNMFDYYFDLKEPIELLRYSENNNLLLLSAFGENSRACTGGGYAPIAFKANGNKATLIVDFYAYGTDSYPESVEFVKENGVWKISGGTVFGYLHGENGINTLNYNPSTGDASSYTVPALTVAAIISVALPVTLLRKRRRVV